jgi:hypothetical protein
MSGKSKRLKSTQVSNNLRQDSSNKTLKISLTRNLPSPSFKESPQKSGSPKEQDLRETEISNETKEKSYSATESSDFEEFDDSDSTQYSLPEKGKRRASKLKGGDDSRPVKQSKNHHVSTPKEQKNNSFGGFPNFETDPQIYRGIVPSSSSPLGMPSLRPYPLSAQSSRMSLPFVSDAHILPEQTKQLFDSTFDSQSILFDSLDSTSYSVSPMAISSAALSTEGLPLPAYGSASNSRRGQWMNNDFLRVKYSRFKCPGCHRLFKNNNGLRYHVSNSVCIQLKESYFHYVFLFFVCVETDYFVQKALYEAQLLQNAVALQTIQAQQLTFSNNSLDHESSGNGNIDEKDF